MPFLRLTTGIVYLRSISGSITQESSAAASNVNFDLSTAVAHGITVVAPTNTVFRAIGYAAGGAELLGFNGATSSATSPLSLSSLAYDYTSTTPGILVTGIGKNGTGVQALAAGVPIIRVANFDQNLLEVRGTPNMAAPTGSGLVLHSGMPLMWGSSALATADVFVYRDAAGTVAQKDAANAQAFRIYGTTTGPKYLSLSHNGTNGVIDTSASSGLLSIAPTNATSVSLGKSISSYNGVTTAGTGVPIIVAAGGAAAVTAVQASVATYTVGASDGTFEVSGNVLVTTSTTHSFSIDVTYTDEGNTSRTLVLPVAQLAGAFITSGLITNVTGAGPYESPAMTIRCKAATAITVRTSAGGTYTTVTFNVRGIIKQVA